MYKIGECYGCTERHEGCHSKCDKYIDKAIIERNNQAEEQRKYILYLQYTTSRQVNIRKRLIRYAKAEGVKLSHIARKINLKPYEIYNFKVGDEDLNMRILNKLDDYLKVREQILQL